MNYLLSSFLFFFLFASCDIEPYEGDILEDPVILSCPEASQNSADAALAFTNATTDYGVLCYEYKLALENAIAVCEDNDGSLQLILDGFGNCQFTESQGGNYWPINIEYYSRNDNGDYKVLVSEMTADLAGLYRLTQSCYGYKLLKDYLDVGSQWNDTFQVTTSYEPLLAGGVTLPDVVSTYTLNHEILEKDISVTIDSSYLRFGNKSCI